FWSILPPGFNDHSPTSSRSSSTIRRAANRTAKYAPIAISTKAETSNQRGFENATSGGIVVRNICSRGASAEAESGDDGGEVTGRSASKTLSPASDDVQVLSVARPSAK